MGFICFMWVSREILPLLKSMISKTLKHQNWVEALSVSKRFHGS